MTLISTWNEGQKDLDKDTLIEKCYSTKLNVNRRNKSNNSLESKKPTASYLWYIIYITLNNNYGNKILVTAENSL